MKPYVSHNTPKIKVQVPSVPVLDLAQAEVNILDIVAPHHKKLRADKIKNAEKAERRAAAEAARLAEEERAEEQGEETDVQQEQQQEDVEAEIVNEKKEKESRE